MMWCRVVRGNEMKGCGGDDVCGGQDGGSGASGVSQSGTLAAVVVLAWCCGDGSTVVNSNCDVVGGVAW